MCNKMYQNFKSKLSLSSSFCFRKVFLLFFIYQSFRGSQKIELMTQLSLVSKKTCAEF